MSLRSWCRQRYARDRVAWRFVSNVTSGSTWPAGSPTIAAKWTTTSAHRTTCPQAAWSLTLAARRPKLSFLANARSDFPPYKSESTARTSCPRKSSSRQRRLPRYPAPPVTATLIGLTDSGPASNRQTGMDRHVRHLGHSPLLWHLRTQAVGCQVQGPSIRCKSRAGRRVALAVDRS